MSNTIDEILDRITQDGRYSSAKEFSILFVESQDELGGLSPIQFRKAKAKQQIQALITEARNKALDDVKFYGHGYDDGTGFSIKISYEQLNALKLTPKENK